MFKAINFRPSTLNPEFSVAFVDVQTWSDELQDAIVLEAKAGKNLFFNRTKNLLIVTDEPKPAHLKYRTLELNRQAFKMYQEACYAYVPLDLSPIEAVSDDQASPLLEFPEL